MEIYTTSLMATLQDYASLVFPSWNAAGIILVYFTYLYFAGFFLPGRVIPGVLLADKSRISYRCNGFATLLLLIALLGITVVAGLFSPAVIADRGGELLSTTFILSILITLVLYFSGRSSHSTTTSLKPHVTNSFIHDWWFGIQLNPQFLGIDLNWDIIAENLGFMLVFGDLVWIPFTFSIQGWWLLTHKADITKAAAILNVLVFIIGYRVFRGSNKQKHIFKKDPTTHIWGEPPKVIGGKLLASGYWGIARHCNYLGDLLLAFSFSLPCGATSLVPYFYPVYLLILLIWRERRDEARCHEKYREDWVTYCKVVPWRILPYVY
ncbi:delta(14)-sterol reductase isoform X2 [Cryptomeria japonica]|uniref:delta(14)-sterol reductase isoform X2 n=1 Tax=Cryptomeria japonica TaxID=3369 RepID=UPI0025AD8259|nr:delta(14)-sterol reductase isoform X2 [Cryptomeria japonica]